MTFELFDNVKPSDELLTTWRSLEAVLLAAIRDSPVAVTPEELLVLAETNTASDLHKVVCYLHDSGFVESEKPTVPALYQILRIDPLTFRTGNVALVKEGERLVLDYFASYSLETRLRTFLMQELAEPLEQLGATGRRMHRRATKTGQIIRSLRAAVANYQRARKVSLGIYVRQEITVGDVLNLPDEVLRRMPKLTDLLSRYRFSSTER